MGDNTFIKAAVTDQENSEIDEEIRSNIKKLSRCVQELKRKKFELMSKKDMEEEEKFKAAMEVWNRDQDFMEKKLSEFCIKYNLSDRELNEVEELKCDVLEKKQQNGDNRSNDLEQIKDYFDPKDFTFGEFGGKGGEKTEFGGETPRTEGFEKQAKNIKKSNLVKMPKGLDESDDHKALTSSNGVKQNMTGLRSENVAMDGLKKEEPVTSEAVKKMMNSNRNNESCGFDDLKVFGQLLGIEKNSVGKQDCTSLAVGFDDVNKMFNNPKLRESDQSESVTDLEVSSRIKRDLDRNMNESTHEKENLAKKLKKEEEADEEKVNDEHRNTLKVISERVADLEIDLSGLQVDVVCLISEKEQAVLKLLRQSSLEHENPTNGKLEAIKVISDQAAELEIDLSVLEVDLVLFMSEIEKAVAKFQELTSKLEKLKWDDFEKKLEVVNVVKNETIDLMEPTDHVTVHKIESVIKRSTHGGNKQEKGQSSTDRSGCRTDLRIEKMEL